MEKPGGGNRRPPQGDSPVAQWKPLKPRAPAPRGRWEAPPTRPPLPATRVQWERAAKTMTFEHAERIKELERGMADVRRGLKEVREAFEYKASDPAYAHRDPDIDTWAGVYGPKPEDWKEVIGRWADTQDSRLRADARQYFRLQEDLRRLEVDLLAYKTEHGLH